jgi:hypothetical protein
VRGPWQHSYLVAGYTDSSNRWLDVDELCRDVIRALWDARGEAPPRMGVLVCFVCWFSFDGNKDLGRV